MPTGCECHPWLGRVRSRTFLASGGYVDTRLFGVTVLRQAEVDCTLDDGTPATCHELTFAANSVGDVEGDGTVGPYCPESILSERSGAGLGIYDGISNP